MKRLFPTLLHDSGWLVIALLVSAGIGCVANSLRSEPVPLIYEAPGAGLVKVDIGEQWKEGIQVVEVDVVDSLIKQRGALVLDARPDLFYEFGHLPTALNLSRKNYEADLLELEDVLSTVVAEDIPVIVYCAHEHCPDAVAVSKQLMEEKGVKTLLVYEGGYDQWEALGLKTEQGK